MGGSVGSVLSGGTSLFHNAFHIIASNGLVKSVSNSVTHLTGGIVNANKLVEGVDEMSTLTLSGIAHGIDDFQQGLPSHWLLAQLGLDTRTETITNGQFVRLSNSDSTYQKNLMMALGGNENKPLIAFDMLLKQKSDKQNFKIFDYFDLNTKPLGTNYAVDDQAIIAYLVDVKHYTNVTLNRYKVEDSYMYKQYLQVNNGYYSYDLFEQTLKQNTSYGSLTEDIGIYKISTYCKPRTNDVDDDTTYIAERYDSDTDKTYLQFDNIQLNKTDSFTGDGSTDTFDLEDYSIIINSVTINDDDIDSSTYTLLNSFTTGSKIQFDTAPADQDDIKVDFDYLDSSNSDLVEIEKVQNDDVLYLVDISSDQLTGIDFINKDKLQRIIDEIRFLQIQLKNDGSKISNTDHLKIALNFFGTKYKDFNNILDNDNVVDMFITYSAKWNDQRFSETLEYIYGTADNPKSVVIDNNNTRLEYSWLSYTDSNNNTTMVRAVSMNGKMLPVDQQVYMIPVQSIKYHTLMDFFDIQAQNLVYGVFTSQEHTIKWYQTEAFQIAVTVAVITYCVVSQQWYMLATAVGSYAVMQSHLPEWLKVVAVAALIVSGGYAQASANAAAQGAQFTVSASDISMYSFQVANMATSEYFKFEIQQTNKRTKREEDKTRRINDQLNEAKDKAFMYNPFKKYDDYWQTMYNDPYDVYSYIDLGTNPNFGIGHRVNL